MAINYASPRLTRSIATKQSSKLKAFEVSGLLRCAGNDSGLHVFMSTSQATNAARFSTASHGICEINLFMYADLSVP